MTHFFVLLKRDLILMKMNIVKRIFTLIGLSLLLNMIIVIRGDETVLLRSIMGIDASCFRENPMTFPVSWLIMTISGVLVSFDFVKEDFYEYASSIIVRTKRRYFWMSKMIVGVILSIGLALLYFVSFALATEFFLRVEGNIFIDCRENPEICICVFLGIFTAYSIFQLFALLFGECVGVLIVLMSFVLGLGTDSKWYLINHIMPVRVLGMYNADFLSVIKSLFFVGILLFVVTLLGGIITEKTDVFSRKGNE